MTEQSELSEFLDAPAPYYQGYRASDIGQCLYKIWDDSIRPRHFLGADNADGIEAILSDREGHSLHEFIDEDEPLRPIIDFDLPREVYDSIEPKLTGKEVLDSLILAFRKTCLEIFPKWDPKTITIASSSDAKKMSYHISTFGMRLPNIAQVAMFTELVRKKLPTALQGNSIIDNIANKSSFSLRMLGSPKYNEKTEEHVRVKKAILPKDGSIFDFMIRPPNDKSEVIENSPLLVVPEPKVQRIDDTNSETTEAEFELVETLLKEAGKKFSRAEVYEAIQATIAYIETEKPFWVLKRKDSENGLYFGFLAKPVMEINKEIMDPILWHVQNIICDANEELNEYIWNWWAYLVQKPEKKPRSILVLKSTLQQCGKNIITDFIGDKVLGPHLHFATSDLEKILGKFNSPLQGRKLIVLNETGMSSGDWHKFNSRLKDFITTGRVDVERKGLETLRLRDFSGWM
ncbi:hypothetical protein RhiirC2_824985, partial [Rhizophagus irregularis]